MNSSTSNPSDRNIHLSDITNNDASTTKHGFLKKLDNSASHFINGQGSWTTVPAGAMPALTGDVTTSAGAVATTLAVLNKSTLTTDSNPYKFSAYNNATQNITTAGATVAFNTETFDTNSNFASNTYTAPVSGFYWFTAQTAWAATGSQTRAQLTLTVSATDTSRIIGDVSTAAAAFGINGSALVQLTAGDTALITFTPVGATTTLRAGPGNTYFMGFLVSRT